MTLNSMVQSIQWVQLQTPGSSDYQGGSHVCEQFRWIIRWGTWIFNIDMNGSNTGPDINLFQTKKGSIPGIVGLRSIR